MTGTIQSCFQRVEKKYLLTPKQYEALKKGVEAYVQADQYSNYTICNIYYDTEDYRLIRASLDRPVYKEKLRVRSYGVPYGHDKVFVELKKKFDGVVYKRRVTAEAAEAVDWLNGGRPRTESQISREIDWFLRCYRPVPKAYVAYDREAYAGIEDPELRVTFDRAIRCRGHELDLRAGDYGALLLPEDTVLLELKIPGAAPMWLARLLSENGIFATNFSKYGAYYRQLLSGERPAGEFEKEVLKGA